MPTTDELQHEELDVAIQTQRWVVVVPYGILTTVIGTFSTQKDASDWRKAHEPKGFVLPIEDPLDHELAKFTTS